LAFPRVIKFGFAVRALRHRNYALFFAGQMVSLVGSWLSVTATSWLVLQMARSGGSTHVERLLGYVAFASQLPVFLLAPVGGVLVERWDRRKVLLCTQTVSMLQSFAMAALILCDVITMAEVVVLAVLQGMVNAIDIPARQALVVQMVEDPADLSNAIALNSSMVQSARMLGPATAGFLIYYVGEGICFLLDGFSFLAVLLSIALMRLAVRPLSPRKGSFLASLREGLAYASGYPPIRALLLLVATISLMAMSMSVLMPIYATEILGGSERTLGLLLGASGLGALLGCIYLAARRSVVGLGRVIALGPTILGAVLAAFAFSTHRELSALLMLIAGTAMLVTVASANTVLQTIVEDDKRARVMSLFTMAFMGMAPFGSLLAGFVADKIGVQYTLLIAGVVCAMAGAVFASQLRAIRPLLRTVYQSKGIMRPIVAGVEAAAVQAEAARD
jgi:MFS family permease